MKHIRTIFATVAGPVLLASQASAVSPDDLTPDEQVLIAALDRAYKPGLLDTSDKRKTGDGTYIRLVSTGDAIISSTIASPLSALQKTCANSNASLELRLSAGRNPTEKPGVLNIAGTRFEVDRTMLWETFSGATRYNLPTLKEGFRAVFSGSRFDDRAAREADQNPPFGLFACKDADGRDKWAAAIMPLGEARTIYVNVELTPITSRWVREHLAEKERKRISAERFEREQEERQARAIADAQAEEERLKPFRANLRVGSRTNCGIVIAVRDPLVQVQLPPNVLGPGHEREFWTMRDELTDAYPPNGCRYGG